MAKHLKAAMELLAVGLLVVVFFAGGAAQKSRAQTTAPRFMTTWQAKSYAPPQYKGKILPTLSSQITVAFDVLDKGKVADLSKQTINWYLGGQILGSGKGMQTITFLAPESNLGDLELSVELPDYLPNGQLLMNSIRIPVVSSEAVIEAPYPEGVFSGYSPQIKGVPYFFNVSSPSYLNFSWSVNGETAQNAEDPTNLIINLNQDARSGSDIYIELVINNASDYLTAAKAETTLTFQK